MTAADTPRHTLHWARTVETGHPLLNAVLSAMSARKGSAGSCIGTSAEIGRDVGETTMRVRRVIDLLCELDLIFRVPADASHGLVNLYILLEDGMARSQALTLGWRQARVASVAEMAAILEPETVPPHVERYAAFLSQLPYITAHVRDGEIEISGHGRLPFEAMAILQPLSWMIPVSWDPLSCLPSWPPSSRPPFGAEPAPPRPPASPTHGLRRLLHRLIVALRGRR